MADEREGQEIKPGGAASKDKVQTSGREANAAQPLNAAGENAGPERYPSAGRDDSVERTGRNAPATGEGRAFAPPQNPEPPQGAGDSSAPPSATPPSTTDGRLGPGADPAEGKR